MHFCAHFTSNTNDAANQAVIGVARATRVEGAAGPKQTAAPT
jgi:hypothetical protein